jgi:hypothetical protein
VLELTVIGLYPVVGMPFDVIPRPRDQRIEDRRVHRRRVRDHLGGSHLQHNHRPVEEPACRRSVAAGGDEYADDLAVLVAGPVHAPQYCEMVWGPSKGLARVGVARGLAPDVREVAPLR